MKEYFVPYKPSLDMRDMGFNEYFNGWYYRLDGRLFRSDYEFDFEDPRECIAPIYQQAENWLLKKYNLYAIVIPTATMYWTFKTMVIANDTVEVPPYINVDSMDYDTPEKAKLASLIELIKIATTIK